MPFSLPVKGFPDAGAILFNVSAGGGGHSRMPNRKNNGSQGNLEDGHTHSPRRSIPAQFPCLGTIPHRSIPARRNCIHCPIYGVNTPPLHCDARMLKEVIMREMKPPVGSPKRLADRLSFFSINRSCEPCLASFDRPLRYISLDFCNRHRSMLHLLQHAKIRSNAAEPLARSGAKRMKFFCFFLFTKRRCFPSLLTLLSLLIPIIASSERFDPVL